MAFVSDYIRSFDLKDIDVTAFGDTSGVPGLRKGDTVTLHKPFDERFDMEVEGDHPKLHRGAKVIYTNNGEERTGVITGRYKRRGRPTVHAWGVFSA